MRETNEFVFFWGKEDIFSNFYHTFFIHQGIQFRWAEQAIMYRKAKLFGAENIAIQILGAKSPNQCKALGRSREIPFDEGVWQGYREEIYRDVLFDKFSQSRILKIGLLKTEGKILVEASPYDKIWGIGLSDSHPDAENPSRWRGLNLLGNVLMEVRRELSDLERETDIYNQIDMK